MFSIASDLIVAVGLVCLLIILAVCLKPGSAGCNRSALPNPAARATGDLPRIAEDPIAPMDRAEWRAQPLMNKGEYRAFAQLETLAAQSAGFRVFAQVSLGEVFSTRPRNGDKGAARAAYMMVNSKRVDFLIINCSGLPVAAIELQGSGHYQGNAVTRDAVKREAFRRIGVPFLEVSSTGLTQGQIVDLRHLLGLSVQVAAQ